MCILVDVYINMSAYNCKDGKMKIYNKKLVMNGLSPSPLGGQLANIWIHHPTQNRTEMGVFVNTRRWPKLTHY